MTDIPRHGALVREKILHAGLAIMRDDPDNLSARSIGRRVNLSHQAVLYHYGTMTELRNAICAHAVTVGDVKVVAQLIIARHPCVDGMTGDQRTAWLARV